MTDLKELAEQRWEAFEHQDWATHDKAGEALLKLLTERSEGNE